MCGIAGTLELKSERRVSADVVGRMTRILRHRGPDDEGIWVSGPVGLGSRRLAILDLSERGHQPMSNEDGTIWIAYNGEIYNFLDLRARLERAGHEFRSNSDTEAILHLYEREGVDCLKHLQGMFAFALWDARRRRLFIARDRLGKKPLFYCQTANALVFGSEPKALLQHPEVAAEVNPEAVHHFLSYGYVPAPFSAFRNFKKLPPGHYLTVESGRVSMERYWSLSYAKKRHEREEALSEELLSLLDDAVKSRLVSDVPLGALLSGGVDSSAVVALMRRHITGPLRTFSIGFDQAEYNELAHARVVAERFETDHEEQVVRPDAAALLPRLVWHYNEPFADSSALPSFAVCEMARRFVTVALNGDGGDEAFFGYDRYLATKLASYQDRMPLSLRRAVSRAASAMPVGNPKTRGYRLRRFAESLTRVPQERYASWIVLFDNDAKKELYTPEFAHSMAPFDSLDVLRSAYVNSDAATFLEKTVHSDVQLYLPDDLLVKMDIASMANSLELRSPLLDYRVVEFAASLPPGMKLRRLTQKYILKRSMRDLLPEQILRRPKAGFGVPMESWLRGELRTLLLDTLLDARSVARGYFRPAVVQRYIDEHLSGRAHHHPRLWGLLMLELWHRTFIDGAKSPTAAGTATAALGGSVL
jgi:asparagine synthase (glutamine-hydrolysing)